MKKVIFETISIEGFGSIIEKLHFDFDRKGVTIITGKNGVGKSTVFNALFWVLYGTVLKNVNNTAIPTKKAYRGKCYRGTRVSIDFKIDKESYTVVRHINFKGESFEVTGASNVIIAKNGKRLDIQSEDKKDFNKYIVNLIGLDKDSFLNAILFGQKMKRLLDTSDSARRLVFEGMIDLSFLDEALEKCKLDLSHTQDILVKYEIELDSKSDNILNNKRVLKDYKEDLKELKKDRKNNYNSIQKEIEKYKSKIKCTASEDKAIKKLEKKLANYQEQLQKYRDRAKEEAKYIAELDALVKVDKYRYEVLMTEFRDFDKKGNCSKCGAKLKVINVVTSQRDIENRIKAVVKKYRKIENGIRLLELEAGKRSKEFIAINNKAEEVTVIYNERNKNHTSKDTYKEVIEGLKQRLEDIDRSKEEVLKEKIVRYKKEIKNLGVSYYDIQQEIQNSTEKEELLTWWVKKGFSNTGLKQFMFLSFLSKLNVATVKYTAPMGFFIDFGIDTSKASKPFTTKCYFADGVEFNYNEYSGGESVKVSVASMLGINDVICNDVDVNIILFDEVFESLDEAGKESVFELLNMKKGKSIFVITHIQDIDLLNCKKLEVIKKKNNTLIR